MKRSSNKKTNQNLTLRKAFKKVDELELNIYDKRKTHPGTNVRFFKDFLKTAVETKQTVIETPKICNSTVAIKDAKKEIDRRKLPKPADFDDNWYQDHAGNWLNRYNKDGVEYENDGPPTSILSGQRETPLKKTKQKVSFESDVSSRGRVTKSGKNPGERWLWAYGRIVQVGDGAERLVT